MICEEKMCFSLLQIHVAHIPNIKYDGGKTEILANGKFVMSSTETDESLKSIDAAQTGSTLEQLRQKNEQYIQQISTLQNQLNESLEFAQKNEILVRQNAELSSKLRKYEDSADDARRRLEITMKTNEELQIQIDELKKQKERELAQKGQEEITKIKLNFAEQIQKLTDQIRINENLLKKSNDDIESFKKDIAGVISAAQQVYQQTFNSIGEVTEFLLQQPSATTTQISQYESETSELINAFKDQITKKQTRLKEERALRKSLQSKFEEIQRQYESEKQNYEQKIAKLELEILDNVKNTERLKNEHEQQIKAKNDEIEQLMQKIEKIKTKIPTDEEIRAHSEDSYTACKLKQENEDLQSKIDSLKLQLEEQETTSSSMQKQALAVTSQLKSVEISYESLKKKYQQISSELQDKTQELDKLKVEKSTLSLDKTSAEENVKANSIKLKNSQLQAQKLQAMIDEGASRYQKLVSANDALQNQLQNQQNEIKDLISNRDHLIAIIKRENNTLKAAEATISELTALNKSLKKSIKNSESKLAQEIEKSQNGGDIQPSSFYNSDFSRELCTKISEYANNLTIPANSKIKSIVSLISKHYQDILASKESEIKNNSEINDKNTKTIDKFLSQIGSLFDSSSLSCETIVTDPVSAYEVTTRANKLFSDHLDVTNEKSRVEEDLLAMLTKLEVSNTSEGEKMISELYNKINDLHKSLNEERNKMKQTKKVFKKVTDESNEIANNLRQNLSDRDREVQSLKEDISRSLLDNRKLTNEINQLQNENKEIKERIELQKQENEKEKDKIKQKYESQIETINKQNKTRLEAKDQNMNDLKTKIYNLEKEGSQLRRTVQMMRDSKKEQDRNNQFLIDQCENNLKETRKQAEREKEMMKMQYDKYLSEIKDKNNELAKAHDEVMCSLKESEEQLARSNKQLEDSLKQSEYLKQKLDESQEEIERIKRVMEMKERSNILATEMKFETMIEEQKSNFYTEKRNIIGFVVHNFRQYFDANRELDDDCLRDVISRAKHDLDALIVQEEAAKKVLMINSSKPIIV